MMRILAKTKLLGLSLGLLLCFFDIQANDENLSVPQSQTVWYRLSVKSMSVGEAKLEVHQEANQYQATLSLIPNSMVKILGLGRIVEQVKGKVSKGIYQPEHYTRTEDGKLILEAKFSAAEIYVWQQKKRKKQERRTLSIQGDVWQDPVSQILQIQADWRHHTMRSRYELVTGFSHESYELIDRTGDRIKLVTNSDREILMKFNVQGELLKLQKNKRGKSDFVLERLTD